MAARQDGGRRANIRKLLLTVFPAANATLVGSIGVGLLLLTFFLNLFALLRANSYPYIALNLAGGALACLSVWMIGFMPFVALEGTWALVATIAIARKLVTGSPGSSAGAKG